MLCKQIKFDKCNVGLNPQVGNAMTIACINITESKDDKIKQRRWNIKTKNSHYRWLTSCKTSGVRTSGAFISIASVRYPFWYLFINQSVSDTKEVYGGTHNFMGFFSWWNRKNPKALKRTNTQQNEIVVKGLEPTFTPNLKEI